jgi:ribosomal protein S18 acetylase RimI-like enzyme
LSIKYDGIDDRDNEVYSLYENGQKVGWIKVRFDLCSIIDIFVKKEKRNEGHGTKLVRFIESLAVQKKCAIMRTNPINPEARGFFEKCGYKIDSDEHGRKIIQLEW